MIKNNNNYNTNEFFLDTLITFFIYLFIYFNYLWVTFDPHVISFQHYGVLNIYIDLDISTRFGMDGISFFFMYLTNLIIPLCMLYTINSRNTTNDI